MNWYFFFFSFCHFTNDGWDGWDGWDGLRCIAFGLITIYDLCIELSIVAISSMGQ